MSMPDSTFPNRNYNTLPKKYPDSFVSLNSVLKGSLKKVQARVDHMQLIIRCETLPQIKAEHGEIVKLFDGLLGMILNLAPQTSKLFLYVDCEEVSDPASEMNSSEGLKRYVIRFHANVSTHDNWKLVNSQALANCRQILSNYHGTLAVNEISRTGCLFSFSLPGKIE
jgi:hypothetical protein